MHHYIFVSNFCHAAGMGKTVYGRPTNHPTGEQVVMKPYCLYGPQAIDVIMRKPG